MALELHEESGGRVLDVQASGRLTKDDYARFTPEVDRLIKEHGRISILFEMHDFHGWNAGAMWEDTKFAMRHFHDIDRLAVVGEKKWQKGMAVFCRPFTKAQISYFDHQHEGEAKQWIRGPETAA